MRNPKATVLNQRFGRLVAVEEIRHEKHATYWRCICECGGETVTQRTALVQGRTRSCGCLRREVSSRKRGPKLLAATPSAEELREISSHPENQPPQSWYEDNDNPFEPKAVPSC